MPLSTLISVLVYLSVAATPLIVAVSLCMMGLMTHQNWRRQRGRLVLMLLWGVLGITLVGGWLWLDKNVRMVHRRHRDELTAFAKTIAAALEVLGHSEVASTMSPTDPLVVRLEHKVLFWLQTLPDVASIYTLRQLESGDWIFVICPPTDLNRDGIYGDAKANESYLPVGTLFDQTDADKTQWLPCLRGESVFNFDRTYDQWGSWITAAEPLHNDCGEVEAICALDFWSDQFDIDLMLARLNPQVMMVVLLSIFFTTTNFLLQGWRKVAEMRRYAVLLETHLQHETKRSAGDHHDLLHAPITSILDCTKVLENDTASPAEQDCAAELILRNAEQLLATLNDILDISKIEANKNGVAAAQSSALPLAGQRILLAEDSADSRRLFEAILTKSGAYVVAVSDGLAAFETTVNCWRAGRDFDLLLIDVQMPVMDGLTVVRYLRGIEYRGTILALTAYTSPEEVGQCHAAGCNGHATKPIRRDELIEVVRRYTTRCGK